MWLGEESTCPSMAFSKDTLQEINQQRRGKMYFDIEAAKAVQDNVYVRPHFGTVPVLELVVQFRNWNTHLPKSAPRS